MNLPTYINPKLVWDYPLTTDLCATEAFERWYTARVLARGTLRDVQRLGLPRIRRHFSTLTLPKDLRAFWEWYLTS